LRKIECPYGGWIGLPDEWLGIHLDRRDQAAHSAEGLSNSQRQFAIAMVLLEDWSDLPGLTGNPKKWDFNKIPAKLIVWLLTTILSDFDQVYHVQKKSLAPSINPSTAEMAQTGPSETLT
jgi:hypothetical protein